MVNIASCCSPSLVLLLTFLTRKLSASINSSSHRPLFREPNRLPLLFTSIFWLFRYRRGHQHTTPHTRARSTGFTLGLPWAALRSCRISTVRDLLQPILFFSSAQQNLELKSIAGARHVPCENQNFLRWASFCVLNDFSSFFYDLGSARKGRNQLPLLQRWRNCGFWQLSKRMDNVRNWVLWDAAENTLQPSHAKEESPTGDSRHSATISMIPDILGKGWKNDENGGWW